MKITDIEAQKKRKNRYNIYIDDEFAFGLDEEVVMTCSLSIGMELTDSFIEEIIKKEEYKKAYNYAIRLLAFRSRSEKEIRDKMKLKGYEEQIINKTIDLLYDDKYLNDLEFGRSLIRDKQNFNGAGKNLLKNELYKKGLNKELINELIEENVSYEDEYKRALELAEKKNSKFSIKDDKNKKYRQLSGLLSRKGYSFDIISKVVKKVINNEDEFDDYD